MVTWKLTLEYDGTKYSGSQEQRNAKTVLGTVRRAAEEYLECEVELQGAGRTDAGVHALAQVAHLRVPSKAAHSGEAIRRVMNSLLPSDIVIVRVERERPQFHARHDAMARAYLYRISTRKSAFEKKYVWWVKEKLDVPAMARAAGMLVGRHDFQCFRAEDPTRRNESTVVVIDSASIHVEGHMILFRIEASHFLWRMVRRIVGALVMLGKGEIREQDLVRLLAGRCEMRLDVAAWTAPAAGLFLETVTYRV